MSPEMDWDSMVRDWKSNDEAPSPELAKRVQRGTWTRYVAVAFAVALFVFMVSLSAPLIVHGGHLVLQAVGVFVLGVATVLAVFSVRTLLGALRPEAQTTRAFLQLEKRRSEGELRAVKMIRGTVLALLVFNLLWGPWKLYVDRAMYAAEPWRALVGWGSQAWIMAILWIPTRFTRPALQRRIAAIDEVLRAHDEA